METHIEILMGFVEKITEWVGSMTKHHKVMTEKLIDQEARIRRLEDAVVATAAVMPGTTHNDGMTAGKFAEYQRNLIAIANYIQREKP